MVNPFTSLFEEKEPSMPQKNQHNTLPSEFNPNSKKRTFKQFLRSNAEKVLLLMLVIYVAVHIYNSMYCKESFVTFQSDRNGQQHQLLKNPLDQQHFLSVEGGKDLKFQQKAGLSPKNQPSVKLEQTLAKSIQNRIVTPKQPQAIKQQATNEIPLPDHTRKKGQKLSLTVQTDNSASLKFDKYKHEYQTFVNSLKEDHHRQQNKEKKISEIYDDLNYNHRLNIHAQTSQEFSHLVTSFTSKKQEQELALRLTLQNKHLLPSLTDMDNQYNDYLKQKYNLENSKQNFMCIILTTHNNAFNKQITRSLNSIYNQQYSRYQVVIADRASTDSTYNIIQQYIQSSKTILQRTTLLQTNQESQVYALRVAAQSCKADSFAVYLDANTQLVGRQVLKTLSFEFSENHSNIVYGSYFQLDVSKQKIRLNHVQGYDESQVFMLLYRNLAMKPGRMVAFKTNSVVNIPQQYLKFNNKYFSFSGIQSLLVPLLQISCGKINTIDVPLSLSLVDSQISKKEQVQRKHQIRQISSFLKLDLC